MNGKMVPNEQAVLPVNSAAVFYATNVFEGLRAYWNAQDEELYCFRLDEHFTRFRESLKMMRMEIRVQRRGPDQRRARGAQGQSAAGRHPHAHGRLLPWRRPRRYGPTGVYINPRRRASQPEGTGIACDVSSWVRTSDNAIPIRLKSGSNYQNGRLATLQSKANGYDQPIFLNNQGHVAEGTGATLFIVRKGRLVTPPVTADILESITRTTLMDYIGPELFGLSVQERDIDRTELYVADEAFFCGSGYEITPITSIDRFQLGDGNVGPITMRLMRAYMDIVRGVDKRYPEWRTPYSVAARGCWKWRRRPLGLVLPARRHAASRARRRGGLLLRRRRGSGAQAVAAGPPAEGVFDGGSGRRRRPLWGRGAVKGARLMGGKCVLQAVVGRGPWPRGRVTGGKCALQAVAGPGPAGRGALWWKCALQAVVALGPRCVTVEAAPQAVGGWGLLAEGCRRVRRLPGLPPPRRTGCAARPGPPLHPRRVLPRRAARRPRRPRFRRGGLEDSRPRPGPRASGASACPKSMEEAGSTPSPRGIARGDGAAQDGPLQPGVRRLRPPARGVHLRAAARGRSSATRCRPSGTATTRSSPSPSPAVAPIPPGPSRPPPSRRAITGC